MKSCNIYFDSAFVYVIASAETTHGFNLATEPMVKLALPVGPARLGTTVLGALNAYKTGVPVPKDLGEADRALLRFLGYRSWRTFERGARCVLVELKNKKVQVSPTKLGSEGGFLFLPEHGELTDCEPQNIGTAIMRALTFCA